MFETGVTVPVVILILARSAVPDSLLPQGNPLMRTSCLILYLTVTAASSAADFVDFRRDVYPILSDACLMCHGPDEEARQANLRLDLRRNAISKLDSDAVAVVPGNVADSELIARIMSTDKDRRMPPADSGYQLSAEQIDLLIRWITQGAKYSEHWAWVAPQTPSVPVVPVEFADWPRNAVDHFVLHRMQQYELRPSEPADRYALIRRVSLDLTGLPPTIEEADDFAASNDPHAYEILVDGLLQRDSFGEHWARKWLDLARYADSAGYADDPHRTIWAWRDWVIRAINSNMPFDQFTIEQMAGDLLPNASDDQVIATAFHRNTMTNSEGGTIDEEFRNVAIVDRVNTTFAVWMGTTMACAQCHSHKYDPITQDEYFQVFAILNNTQDADRRDESPVLEVFSSQQLSNRRQLQRQIAELRPVFSTSTQELVISQEKWEEAINTPPQWLNLIPAEVARSSGGHASIEADGTVLVSKASAKDTYSVKLSLTDAIPNIAAIRLETLPHHSLPDNGPGLSSGEFVITGLKAQIVPLSSQSPRARFVRITNTGTGRFLSLAEVQVFSGSGNIARQGQARQSSTDFDGSPDRAIDGNTDGDYPKKSTTHTAMEDDPWWELDLGRLQPIEAVQVWNRTDGGLHLRLKEYRVELLDEDRTTVWQTNETEPPDPSQKFVTSGSRDIALSSAFADYHQPEFEPADVLSGTTGDKDGWAIGGETNQPHQLILVPELTVRVEEPSLLSVMIEQQSPHPNHLLGHFRISVTADDNTVRRSRLPADLAALLDQSDERRSPADAARFAQYYREHIAPELAEPRRKLKRATAALSSMTPVTTVPVLREIADERRETHLQFRGNWLNTGHQVGEGVPAVFHPLSDNPPPNRLALAEWLVDDSNPLTARVLVNRYWEALFGRGLVITSEDFGSQGTLPTHPELLDWLATEMIRIGWDRKAMLRELVLSKTYRQSARVSPESAVQDPDNRWLARGPRVRLSAEMVRDQALSVSGLLSSKMYGPPVRPPRPSQGLKAAFGSSTDWVTSEGEDRFRRGLYTSWRRSNPYPSMAAFDAPNREVCTVRRTSTNTPLQSLVTLNDPVYVEASQSLARNSLQSESSLEEQLTRAFRQCLIRRPTRQEITALTTLFDDARIQLKHQDEAAVKLATDPLGPLPAGLDVFDTAAMTVVGNVLLNLDEMFLKR